MLSFAALNSTCGANNPGNNPKKLNKEAAAQQQRDVKVTQALERYSKRALPLLHKGRVLEARLEFEEIIEEMEPLLTSLVGGVKFTGSNIQKSPLHLVLYLSHKNYAQILEQQQELAAKKSKLASSSSSCTPAALPATQLPPSAFLHYAKAAAIDSSDPALMLKLGDLALQKEGWFSIARNVYYCGYMGGGNSCEYVSLNFNRTTGAPLFTKSASSSSSSTSSLPIGPTRKSCLYGLIEALWELGEFTDCLFYINQALLHDPHWTKSQQGIRCRWIQHSIIKLHLAGRHSLTSLYEVDIAAQDIIDFTQLDATVESLVANNPLLCRPRSSCIPLPTTDDVNTAPLPLTTTLGGSNDKEEIIVVELEDWAELGRALVDACDRFAFDDNIDGEVSRRVNSLLAPIRIEIAKSNTAAGDASSISNGGNVEDVMMIDSTFDPDAAPVSQVILADNDNEGVTNIDAGSSKRKRIRNDMVSVLGGEEATRTAASGATATAASADGEKMAGNNEEEGNNDEEEQEEEEEDDDDEGGETTRSSKRVRKQDHSSRRDMMVYSDSSLCFTISEILPDAFNFPFSGCESEEKDGLVSQSTPPPPQQQEPSSDDQEQDNSYGGGGGQIIANPTSYFAKLWSTLDMLPKETPKNRRGRRPGVKSLKRTAKKNRQLVEFRLPKSAPFASSITASALSSIPASPSAVIGGTTSDVHAFISSLPRTAGVLDYMRAYLLKIMSPDSNTCAVIAWSSDAFGEIIVKMIQRLEKYGAGLSFWSALDNCKGADMKYNQLYLAICEVLYQQVILQTENLQKSNLFGAQFEMALAESTQFVNDFPTEYSNQSTLLSNSLWKMLWRYWAVVSSNLSVWMVDQESAEGGTNRIEESLSDLRLISRFLWLFAKMEHRMDRTATAVGLYRKCKEWLDRMPNELQNPSPFETTCTAEEIDHHISMLEVRNYILETDGFFSSGDMETTKQRLLHVFLPPLLSKDVATIAADTTASNADSAPSAEKIDIAQDFIYLECDWQRRATLLGYLQKSCQDEEDRWVCLIVSFLDILKSLQSAAKEDSVLVFGKLEELISRLLVLMETGNVSSRIDALKKRRCVNRFRHSTRATENSCSSSLCEEDFLDVGGRFVVVADNDGTSLYDQFLYGIYTVLKIVFAILLKMDATSIVNFNETLKTVAFRGVLLFYQTIKMLAPVITALVAPCSSSSSKPKKNDIDDVVVASIAPSASTALLPLLNSAVSARRNSKAAAVAADESSFSASTNDSSEMDWMAECIIFLHQILGKRQLCTMDNGAILKTEVAYLAGLDDQHYHRELYQCYYCIYGIYVKVDNEVHIDEHHVSEHQTFDRDCATEVFNAVADYIQEKIDSKSYRGISNDVRSCLDKIAAVFTTPPWENAKVSRNKEFINRYLSSDIDPLEPAPDRGLAIKELAHFGAADRSKISDVFFRIYYIQGKVAWAQHKSKTSQLKSKRADVLPLGIESFQYDVYLNPLDFDSWLSLALCHVNSAYEALSWSALEIKLHYADIKNHQIRAFHCFSQASQLYRLKHVKRGRGIKEALVLMVPPERTKFSRQEIAETLFYEFGRLCYSIVTQPMAGGAAHSKLAAVKQIWTKRMKLVKLGDAAAANQDIVLEDDDKSFNSTVHGVLRVGVWAFKRAIQLDSEEWRYPYMVARTLEKLHAEPETVLQYYQTAISLVPEQWTTKEQELIMDPHYKMTSYMIKLLRKGLISPERVEQIVQTHKPAYWPKHETMTTTLLEEAAAHTDPLINHESSFTSSAAEMGKEKIISGDDHEQDDTDTNNIADANLQTEFLAKSDEKIQASSDPVHNAFLLLYRTLELMRILDKRRWQHVVAYKCAWMQYHIFKNAASAQEDIQSLFHMRITAKSFQAFYITEFERPGKFFLNMNRYTLLLIRILTETRDIEGLRLVCRKVKKSENFLRPEIMWKEAFHAMFGVLDACSGSEQGCIQLSGIMTRTEFDGKCPEVEAAIMAAAVAAATSSDKSEKATSSSSATASTVDQTDTYGLGVIGGDSGSGSSGNINSTVSTQVQALVRSFELKKLNDGAENDEKLDLLLVDVYSSLFLEFGGYLKQQQKQRGQEYQQEKEANSNYESVRDRGGVASTSTYSSRSTLPPAASVLTIDTAAVVESKVGDIESTYAPAPSLPPSASPPLVIKEPLSFGHVLKRVLLLCKQQSAFKPPRAPRNSSSTSAGNGSNSSSSINTATANTNSARVLAKLAAAAAAAAEAEEEKEEEEETAGDEMSSTVAAVDGVVSAIVGNVEEKETIITTEGEVDVDVEMQVEVVGEVEGEFEGGLGVNEGEGEGEEDHEQPATTTNDEDDDNNNNNDMDVSV